MIKIYIFFFLILIPLLVADEIETNQTLNTIAHERTWLKLLYYDETTKQSDVVSKEYFLSDRGAFDPLEELKSTINSYYEPFPEDPNEHAICRFPARYEWLNQKVHLKNYQRIPTKCAKLRQSMDETQIDSLSLMFVSGYLGNPASSFGHSFFKLNNYTQSSNNLFDLSISYGADVPINENIFAYMYKGLTGKYDAAFKDKYFFSQDLVYSNNEFRDIWEYKLNLSKEKVSFFQLHLWEIVGKNFQYLFLNKNCGYELSKMLEIIQDEEIAKSSYLWFAPIETFHTLSEIDSNHSIIKQKIFHPSEQKKVYKKFQMLSETEQEIATDLVKNEMEDPFGRLYGLEDAMKIDIMNFIITYYNYILVKEKGDLKYEELKKKALLYRFALPAQREADPKFPDTVAPDLNDKPTVFSINFNNHHKKEKYLSINFSPYSILSIGDNNLDGDELKVLDTEFGIDEHNFFLKELNLITIKQFDRYGIPFEDYMKFSWQFDITVKNTNLVQYNYDTFINIGIGKTWIPSKAFMIYTMLNSSIHSDPKQVTFGPEIGSRIDIGSVKIVASLENGFELRNEQTYSIAKVVANFKMKKDSSLFFRFQNNSSEPWLFSTGFQFYF